MKTHFFTWRRFTAIDQPLHILAAVLSVSVLCACNVNVPGFPAIIAPTVTTTPTSSPTPTVIPAETATPTISPTPLPKVERAVIISLDGLRPDGLLRANIPRISVLINGGASSFTARTVLPSGTLPGHASMVSGRCVSQHGIIWNDLVPSNEPLQGPTVFSIAKDAGLRTVMVVGKEKLITLARPGTVDSFRYEPDSVDERIVQTALDEAANGFGILFVHFILPDYFGHLNGWMSAEYLHGIDRDDAVVGTLVDGLETLGLLEDTLIVLTSDHGGHDFTHGTNLKEDMTIPWIVYGAGVLEGLALEVPVSIMDTAATVVWAMGWPVPADWAGRPVVEAFGLRAEQVPVPTADPYRCGI
ncbi:MAG: alkaline phosphatase family protein [Anaerolineales bacterium]